MISVVDSSLEGRVCKCQKKPSGIFFSQMIAQQTKSFAHDDSASTSRTLVVFPTHFPQQRVLDHFSFDNFLQWVFGMAENADRGYSAEELEFTRVIMSYWANFAKYG